MNAVVSFVAQKFSSSFDFFFHRINFLLFALEPLTFPCLFSNSSSNCKIFPSIFCLCDEKSEIFLRFFPAVAPSTSQFLFEKSTCFWIFIVKACSFVEKFLFRRPFCCCFWNICWFISTNRRLSFAECRIVSVSLFQDIRERIKPICVVVPVDLGYLVLGKLADRAFSRQGKNGKFSRQFYHNWS